MKKLLPILIAAGLILALPYKASASAFSVDPFYAIQSYGEYENVKDLLKDESAINYGWSRIAKDVSGVMVFTTERNSISKFDTNNRFAIPQTVDGKLTQQMRKEQYPAGKNLLMVYFYNTKYEDGSINTIDLLNMNKTEWDQKIISPMISAVEKNGFDGVTLDIEGIMDSFTSDHYNESQNKGLKQKYNSFIDELKSKLNGKTLYVCVNMPSWFTGYDYVHIYNTADQVILLSYSYEHTIQYDKNDGIPELIGKIKTVDIPEAQPYQMVKSDVDSVIKTLKQNVPNFNPKKISLGVTLQVNGWIEKDMTYQSKSYKYYEKMNSLESGSALNISSLDDIESINAPGEYIDESPIYKYSSKTYRKVINSGLNNGEKSIEYYYDTPGTIFEKYYSLVNDNNLAGISVWRLGMGGAKTWSNICSIFNYGSKDMDELPYKLNVPKDKVWKVKFNNPVDETSITSSKESIAVIDTEGNMYPAVFSFDSEGCSVNVSMPSGYKPGHVYYLLIGNNIKSKTGSQLSKPVLLKFKINEY